MAANSGNYPVDVAKSAGYLGRCVTGRQKTSTRRFPPPRQEGWRGMRKRDIADPATEAEVEITPEMIEAGICALVSYSSYFELEEDGVRKIYIAMVNAKRRES